MGVALHRDLLRTKLDAVRQSDGLEGRWIIRITVVSSYKWVMKEGVRDKRGRGEGEGRWGGGKIVANYHIYL